MKEKLQALSDYLGDGNIDNSYRGVGCWATRDDVDLSGEPDYKHVSWVDKEAQLKHANKVMEKYGYCVYMTETHTGLLRIHSPESFACNMLTMVYGSKVSGEYDERAKKIEDMCLDILRLHRGVCSGSCAKKG